MPKYEIIAVSDQVRDWSSSKGGAMKSYRVGLKNGAGATMDNVEWARKAESPPPAVGQTIDCEVDTSGQYGPKIKMSAGSYGGGGGGGGGGRGMSPGERRMIAMQASQKVAVDAVRAAIDGQLWKPSTPDVIGSAVIAVADKLYLRVLDAEQDTIKPQ